MKYLFLNSYLNAIEKHIADQIDFDRMINAKDRSDAMDVLQDTDYGRWALESDDLEEIFESEKTYFSNDLAKMGAEKLKDLFSVRADIVNLRVFLKREMFNLDSGSLLNWGKNEKQLLEEFEEEIEGAKKINSPAKLDDYLTEVYLDRLAEFSKGEAVVESFIAEYREILADYEGKTKDQKIKKIEDDFIFENKKKNEGLAPVLAFFMRKWRAEKKVRTIITGKEIEFSPKKIKNLVEDLRSI